MSSSRVPFFEANTSRSQIQSIYTYCLSTVAVTLIISLGLFLSTQHSGYHLQNLYFPVNRTSCKCDCWDGFYRGIHSRGGYKTFYFNYEKQTIVILGILLFYAELLRHLLVTIISTKQLISILLIPSIYSNFYGIWSIINYLNDHDYYRMLKSQLYFSITELVASYIFYRYLFTAKTQIPRWFIYVLVTISSVHLLLAFGELNVERVLRNIAILLSDLISLVWVAIVMIKNQKFRPDRRTTGICLSVGFCLWLFYHTVCPFRE